MGAGAPQEGSLTEARQTAAGPTVPQVYEISSPAASPKRSVDDPPAHASQLYRESVEAARRQRELEKEVRILRQQVREVEQAATIAPERPPAAEPGLGQVVALMNAAEARQCWLRLL